MEQLKIGWGRRKISTEEPVSIPGQMYLRISQGVQDPLYVSALAIDGGEGQDCVIFCSCDLVKLYEGLIAETKALVSAVRPELPVDSIIMNVTHTHAGTSPRTETEKAADGTYIYPSSEYRKFFLQMCAEATMEAWDHRAPGGIGYGYGYAVVAHSRRVVYSTTRELNPIPLPPTATASCTATPTTPIFPIMKVAAIIS